MTDRENDSFGLPGTVSGRSRHLRGGVRQANIRQLHALSMIPKRGRTRSIELLRVRPVFLPLDSLTELTL